MSTEEHEYSQFTKEIHKRSIILLGKEYLDKVIFICPVCSLEHDDIEHGTSITCKCGTTYLRYGNTVQVSQSTLPYTGKTRKLS